MRSGFISGLLDSIATSRAATNVAAYARWVRTRLCVHTIVLAVSRWRVLTLRHVRDQVLGTSHTADGQGKTSTARQTLTAAHMCFRSAHA